MDVLFIASTAVITTDPATSRQLYVDALGLPLDDQDGYWSTSTLGGSKHFGVWPLAQAAQSCFGTDTWPADRPVPQASVEFEVASPEAVGAAEAELQERGHVLLHATKTEPWGQTVCRLQDLTGCIVGISFAPWMH